MQLSTLLLLPATPILLIWGSAVLLWERHLALLHHAAICAHVLRHILTSRHRDGSLTTVWDERPSSLDWLRSCIRRPRRLPTICSIDCCRHLAIGQARDTAIGNPEAWVGGLQQLAWHALILRRHGHEQALSRALVHLRLSIRWGWLLVNVLLPLHQGSLSITEPDKADCVTETPCQPCSRVYSISCSLAGVPGPVDTV